MISSDHDRPHRCPAKCLNCPGCCLPRRIHHACQTQKYQVLLQLSHLFLPLSIRHFSYLKLPICPREYSQGTRGHTRDLRLNLCPPLPGQRHNFVLFHLITTPFKNHIRRPFYTRNPVFSLLMHRRHSLPIRIKGNLPFPRISPTQMLRRNTTIFTKSVQRPLGGIPHRLPGIAAQRKYLQKPFSHFSFLRARQFLFRILLSIYITCRHRHLIFRQRPCFI